MENTMNNTDDIASPEPLFSVITAIYNNEKYITEAIESVLKQTFSDWELIIVDDGSTDNSREVIKGYLHDKRIRLVCHDTNCGYTSALRTGIANVNSEYFAILDSDDSLAVDAIETMYSEHIKMPDCGYIYSQFVTCDADMTPGDIGFCKAIPSGKSNIDLDAVYHLKTFKLSHYLRSDGYDVDILYAEDKDISYRMEEVSELAFVDKVLYYYRALPDSICHHRRTALIGRVSMGKSKINALVRRNVISTEILDDDTYVNAGDILDQLAINHPYDLAVFLDILKHTLQRHLLDGLNLPDEVRSCPTEKVVLWIAANAAFKDIMNAIGSDLMVKYARILTMTISKKKVKQVYLSIIRKLVLLWLP